MEINEQDYSAQAEKLLDEAEQEPKLLFKFKSVESAIDLVRFIDIITEHKIYVPTVEQLNDSLEGKGTLILGKEKADPDKRRIFSLSSSCFSPVMWSHYGNNRHGACIGFFKGNPLKPDNKSTFRDAREVMYVDNRNVWSGDVDMAIDEDLFHKNADWTYEKEWRILSSNDELKFEEEDIACVILGEKMDDKTKEHIESNIRSLPVYYADNDPERYCYYLKDKSGSKFYTVEELYEDVKKK